MEIHRAKDRGHTKIDWLDSWHSFSFGDYYDPARKGFGTLRVLNEDFVEAGRGFDTHGHKDMEIVTIVLEGALQHRDSTGTQGIIKPGDVQRMTAGSGIMHSEFNASEKERVHLLQIWVFPDKLNLQPGYEQKTFSGIPKGKFLTVVAGKKENAAVFMNQNAFFSLGSFEKGTAGYERHDPKSGVYLFLIEGEIQLKDQIMRTSDAAALSHEEPVQFSPSKLSKVLAIEVPLKRT